MTTTSPRAAAAALGGSGAEQGAELRASVGALLASAVIGESSLAGVGLPGLSFEHAVGVALAAETDDPADDLVVPLRAAGRVLFQVKRSAGLTPNQLESPLEKTIAQFARAVRKGVMDDDRLVLSCARPTQELVRLGELLERRRLPLHGAPTDGEYRALSKLRVIALRHLDQAEVETLLRHLVIWRTDPTGGDGYVALLGALEARVCRPGQGADAARELAGLVRRLARWRGGLDGLGLAQVLADCGVELKTGLPGDTPVAAARALACHRERHVRRGRTLSLFAAPPQLADLPLDTTDAQVEVDVAGEDRSSGRELELAVRRRGRCLLLGRPGGGKSTALRALCAHAAERASWPVPMLVDLRRLAGGDRPIGERGLDIACEQAPHQERAALRSGLARELAAGRVLLALDGLDEVRRGRSTLIHELTGWLAELPTEVELVLATRPAAAEQARRLGLAELSLRPPDRPEATVRALLEAAAPKGDPAAEAWVQERADWVFSAMHKDSLASTPLTVVTLALIAVRSETPASLPRARAQILLQALQDVLDNWELEHRRHGEVTLG